MNSLSWKNQNVQEILAERWAAVLSTRYASNIVSESVSNLDNVYARFMDSGCADSQFTKQLCSENPATFAQRLGEMLLFERLSHAGFKLESKDTGPDFRVEKDGVTAWLELVTPSTGDDLRIGDLLTSRRPLFPCPDVAQDLRERTLLRVCAAVAAKLVKFEGYLAQGMVGRADACLIVVNDALLCPSSEMYGISHGADGGIGGSSLVEHAVLGVGHQYWEEVKGVDRYVAVPTFREEVPNRLELNRDGGGRGPVPVSLFGQPTSQRPQEFARRARVVSAAMQVTLREDYGFLMKLREHVERNEGLGEHLLFPGNLVRNPNADIALPPSLARGLRSMNNRSQLSGDS